MVYALSQGLPQALLSGDSEDDVRAKANGGLLEITCTCAVRVVGQYVANMGDSCAMTDDTVTRMVEQLGWSCGPGCSHS